MTTPGEAFVLRSPDVREGETIGRLHLYNAMGCTGQNVSPALRRIDQAGGEADGVEMNRAVGRDFDAVRHRAPAGRRPARPCRRR